MSPGATWEPFELSPQEYADLAAAVRMVPVEKLRGRARYAQVAFKFDPKFDGAPETYPMRADKILMRSIQTLSPEEREYLEWMSAVCAKHHEPRRAGP
jgi:hypothetical protein